MKLPHLRTGGADPDRGNEGADADTGSAEVVDLIDLQAGIDLAGRGKDILHLICRDGIHTAAE